MADLRRRSLPGRAGGSTAFGAARRRRRRHPPAEPMVTAGAELGRLARAPSFFRDPRATPLTSSIAYVCGRSRRRYARSNLAASPRSKPSMTEPLHLPLCCRASRRGRPQPDDHLPRSAGPARRRSRAVEWAPAPRRRPGDGGRAPGPRRRARRPRRADRPDDPAPRHRDPGDVARRRGAVVMLPLPMRLGSIEEFVEQTRAADRERRRAALVVVDPQLARVPRRRSPATRRWSTLDELRGRGRRRASAYVAPGRRSRTRSRSCSSRAGRTADPKGVMLPHRCVTANLDAIARPRPSSTTTRPSACRGCRCTTTWA